MAMKREQMSTIAAASPPAESAEAAPEETPGEAFLLFTEDGKRIVRLAPHEWEGKLKAMDGSMNDDFNRFLSAQVASAMWPATSSVETYALQCAASGATLIGIGPKDELEGMLAAQMIAAHAASMECYRRAMLSEQPAEMRAMNLSMANKSSRTFAALLEALNKHRGKGQQTVRVEHVHVYEGGQAVVGVVSDQGGGRGGRKNGKQPHEKQIAHASEPALPSPNTSGELLPIAGDAEWTMPTSRRPVVRGSEGQPQRRNARPDHGPSEGRAAAVRRDAAGDAADDQDG
jgi:hypothetical protein